LGFGVWGGFGVVMQVGGTKSIGRVLRVLGAGC
jgi:hypothetical protein